MSPAPAAPDRGRWVVPATAAGERLDRALAAHLELPRARVKSWIDAGRVEVDGAAPSKAGALLRGGEALAWDPPPALDERVLPEPGELRVLHEDGAFVVLDKPSDLVVHPGAGRASGTLAHRILARYPETAGVGGPGRPGIVHRLDRGTSGALVVARTDAAHRALTAAFARREIDKRYLAIVWGRPKQAAGRIDEPIGRHPTDRQRMAVRPRGRAARTDWRLVTAAGPVALLELTLHTGRTHQIRVHARAIGHPLVGDPTYGEPRHRALAAGPRRAAESFPRPALHAWMLAFEHPAGGARVAVTAPVPEDFVRLWETLAGVPFPVLR